MGRATPKRKQVDGWQNAITKLGTVKDPTLYNSFTGRLEWISDDYDLLDAIYSESGIAKRVVEAYPTAATRAWLRIIGDEEDKIKKATDELKLKKAIREAGIFAKLYGGAFILLYVDDGKKDLAEPMNHPVNKVTKLEVYDKTQVFVESRYLREQEPLKAGQPEYYTVISELDGTLAIVHESRLIYIDGEPVTKRRRIHNNGYGDSVIVKVWEAMGSLGNNYKNIENITKNFITNTLKIQDLSNIIATGREEELKTRAEIMALTSSILRTIYIDGDEDFNREVASVTGLDKINQLFVTRLAIDTGIPEKIVTGQSSPGLTKTGETDLQQWADNVADYEEHILTEPTTEIIKIIAESKAVAVPDKQISIERNPVFTPKPEEIAKTRKTNAEADKIYFEMGVVTIDEIRSARLQYQGYNAEIKPEEIE